MCVFYVESSKNKMGIQKDNLCAFLIYFFFIFSIGISCILQIDENKNRTHRWPMFFVVVVCSSSARTTFTYKIELEHDCISSSFGGITFHAFHERRRNYIEKKKDGGNRVGLWGLKKRNIIYCYSKYFGTKSINWESGHTKSSCFKRR